MSFAGKSWCCSGHPEPAVADADTLRMALTGLLDNLPVKEAAAQVASAAGCRGVTSMRWRWR